MNPIANDRCPIHNLLRERRSPLAFSGRPVEPWKLTSVLEAARWAPSSCNDQPWSFVVATSGEPEPFSRMVGCLEPANAEWAGNAPVLILSVARLRFESTGEPNRHAFHDVGLATANLVVQASAMGLAVHQMAGFDDRRAAEAFGIPEGHEPAVISAVGYAGDPRALPDRLRLRDSSPRMRKPLGAIIHSGSWGRPSDLADWRGPSSGS